MQPITAKKSPELLEYLLGRRSASVKAMGGPGPNPDEIQTILQAASRVPDHGKTVPFYFLVFEGKAREEVGDIIAKLSPSEKAEEESKRFLRAPVVIGVISRARPAKHPRWEQILTAGAVCQNMLLAASSLGYGAQWLTEWYSYEENFRAAMGLDARDTIAGFIHIGTPTEMPIERERPELVNIVTHWQPGVALNKADAAYDQEKFGMPKLGF